MFFFEKHKTILSHNIAFMQQLGLTVVLAMCGTVVSGFGGQQLGCQNEHVSMCWLSMDLSKLGVGGGGKSCDGSSFEMRGGYGSRFRTAGSKRNASSRLDIRAASAW